MKYFDLPPQIQKKIIPAIIALLFLFILNACGNKDNRSYNLDERQAPFLVTGKVQSEAGAIDSEIEEDNINKRTGEKVDRNFLSNVKVDVDFDNGRTVLVEAELKQKDNSTKKLKFEGKFEKQPGADDDYYVKLKDPNEGSILLVAQCTNDCKRILIHSTRRITENDFVTKQYCAGKDGPSDCRTDILSRDRKDNAQTNSGSSNEPQEDKIELADVLGEEEDVEGLVGGFSKVKLSMDDIISLIPANLEEEVKVETVSVSQSQSPSKGATSLPAEKKPQDESKKNNLLKKEQDKSEETAQVIKPQVAISDLNIIGGGVLIREASGTEAYPIDLGDAYPGQAEGCYGSRSNRRCLKGSLSFANIISDAIFGIQENSPERYRYGSGIMKRFLEKVAESFSSIYPNEAVKVTAVSLLNGGKFPPHRSHQNGLDVDLPIPRKANGKLDYDKAWDLKKAVYQQKIKENSEEMPLVQMTITNLSNVKEICKVANKKGEKNHDAMRYFYFQNSSGQAVKDHPTHFHVRLHCTSHNIACTKFITKPRTVSPCSSLGI